MRVSIAKSIAGALLCGVALGVMSAGAQADELSNLKAQLEALKARVITLESGHAQTLVPEGTSLVTFHSGQGSLADWGNDYTRYGGNIPADSGFAIAITPTADLPTPVAELAVYGYVKGDTIYDTQHDMGYLFTMPRLWSSSLAPDKGHVRMHALETRVGVKSKVDTAIGQIRTKVEGDFYGFYSGGGGLLRLRLAYGEWDMTPNWTLLVGQNFQTATLWTGINTVDFKGPAGPNTYNRVPQVRLTYHNGPLTWATAIEEPTWSSSTAWPNLSSYVRYSLSGGHQLFLTGTVADWGNSGTPADNLGWVVLAGANIKLADFARLTISGIYGVAEGCNYLNQTEAWCPNGVNVDRASLGGLQNTNWFGDGAWGANAGVSFIINKATSFNVEWGWSHVKNSYPATVASATHVDVMTVHANILWRPVRQMRMGWEVIWGQYNFSKTALWGALGGARAKASDSTIRAQFGTWFYF